MIQRKQSLWLLVVALLNTCLLFTPFFRWHQPPDTAWHDLRPNTIITAFIVLIVQILAPLVAIFLFRKRKQQMAVCGVLILSVFSFMTIMINKIGSTVPATATDGTYWIGAALPVASVIFLILAMVGIRKDEKLVKSMDRLR